MNGRYEEVAGEACTLVAPKPRWGGERFEWAEGYGGVMQC